MDYSKVKLLVVAEATAADIDAAVDDVAVNKVTYLISQSKTSFVTAVLVPYEEVSGAG